MLKFGRRWIFFFKKLSKILQHVINNGLKVSLQKFCQKWVATSMQSLPEKNFSFFRKTLNLVTTLKDRSVVFVVTLEKSTIHTNT